MREVMEGTCVTTKNSVGELASTGDLPLAARPGTTVSSGYQNTISRGH